MHLLTRLFRSLTIAAAVLLLSYSSTVYGVARPDKKVDSKQKPVANFVTSDLLKRAQSDVQLRKLLALFAERKINSAMLYEKLKRMKQQK